MYTGKLLLKFSPTHPEQGMSKLREPPSGTLRRTKKRQCGLVRLSGAIPVRHVLCSSWRFVFHDLNLPRAPVRASQLKSCLITNELLTGTHSYAI